VIVVVQQSGVEGYILKDEYELEAFRNALRIKEKGICRFITERRS
jgi:hypothetical protein